MTPPNQFLKIAFSSRILTFGKRDHVIIRIRDHKMSSHHALLFPEIVAPIVAEDPWDDTNTAVATSIPA